MTPPPRSLRVRLLRTHLAWSLLWGLALSAAVWLAVQHEIDELLDDSLRSAAEGLLGPLAGHVAAASAATPQPGYGGGRRFTWQLVSHENGARVLRADRGAPALPLRSTPSAGFADAAGWRVYGMSAGHDGQMLYVAQKRDERVEARLELVFTVLVAGLPMALLGVLWLGVRVRHELQPLRALSERLEAYDPLQPGATLGPAQYAELQPVHAAIDALAARLAQRFERERAFTAHAAHALRTPLAGIDAQLAVALREAPSPLQPRLQRVRAAAMRLQRVVTALLAMFRSGFEVHRVRLDLAALPLRLPVEGLTLQVQATQPVHADADLVAAALINLIDNAQRHGATEVTLSTPQADVLRVQDNGGGVDAERRRDLQEALRSQGYEGRTGLGLMLADLVARAHGGALQLPALDTGFAAELHLRPV